ncbi:MAG: hypothetical protein FVQ80_15290 [Planctomycetes bacterium]|nr:hypothetical protein [Planctomycetota bacterium]
MNNQEVMERYIQLCIKRLAENTRVLSHLRKQGLTEQFIFETFRLGHSGGSLTELIDGNGDLNARCEKLRLLSKGKETLAGFVTIPILDEEKAIVNIAGYSAYPQSKSKVKCLNHEGIFNQAFLQNAEELILTESPLDALLLIQNDIPNTTFLFGDDQKYIHFIKEHSIRRIIFTFEGRARLHYELTKNGISTRRIALDAKKLSGSQAKEYLEELFTAKNEDVPGSDTIQEIEGGFLFHFPHLSYRVIGNFIEYSLAIKANIKAFTGNEVFVDSIDLYKNRDRQNYIYNLMERFGIRDQIQLEQDLHQIIAVIEKHKEKKENQKKRVKPQLTDYQKEIGLQFLKNPRLMDEIDKDYTHLGYVREHKNKILLYLIMTSRLMDNPLHSILISRSGAGKSLLVEITEELCPPEDLQSMSDISSQALYYFGENDLKNKFVVIGEKEGSQGSEYPLRELITRRSITKAIPMKDTVSGEIKTVSITVNGPISLAETTTSTNINPENLNRCFVLSIDESEEQTRIIHQLQRKNYTLKGYLQKRELTKILEKNIFAQRLLKPVLTFNPYAEALTFPSSSLKTRRDNEKFLRLINVICFLHQYQRKLKRKKISEHEVIEYIECTPQDYRIAHELLSDGVLDNTLDDLPASARKLLELIKKYLQGRSNRDNIPVDKIIFERKEIRECTSWSFAQVRNNFRILRDYEYLQLIKVNNGLANQYRLTANYSDLDFLNTILKPEELEKRIATA